MNLRQVKARIEMAIFRFRSRCQRFHRGWAYADVWNMDDWFVRTVRPMLIHLRDNHWGVPVEFADNPDKWDVILTEMIYCLEMMDEDKVYDAMYGDDWTGSLEEWRAVYAEVDRNKDRFFAQFSKYFYNLWD